MKLKSPYLVKPHAKIRLSRLATDETGSFKHEDAAKAALDRHRQELADLQEILYASKQKALLIVLQGMDTAGKDGTISHIFSSSIPKAATSPASVSLPPRSPSTTSSGAFTPRLPGAG
jgi:polyphosphate kinase 2 (PPK2 family)